MELLALACDALVASLPDMKDGIAVMLFSILLIQLAGCLLGGALATWFLRRSHESPYSLRGVIIVALACYMGYLVGPYVLVYLVPALFLCALLVIPIVLGDAIWRCCG